MNNFVVLYRDDSTMNPLQAPLGFICQADDGDHAEEQCLNAYPDCGVVWIVEGSDYKNALDEYWKDNSVIQD